MQEKINYVDKGVTSQKVNKRQPSAFDKIIADGLMNIRKKRSLTQQDLGKKLGVSSEMIRKYENCESRLPFGRAYEIVSLLGLNLDAFFISLEKENEKYALSDNQQNMISHYGQKSGLEKTDISELEKAYHAISKPEKRTAFVNLAKELSKTMQD